MAQQIALGHGYFTTVDDIDVLYCFINGPWYCGTNCYAIKSFRGKHLNLHDLIAKRIGLKGQIDHKNRDRLDNRRENLREATQQQNNFNKVKEPNRSSKYKGVTWDKNRNKWQAQIRYNYRLIYLGRFENEIEAAKAYDIKAKELQKEFAVLNFSSFNGKET